MLSIATTRCQLLRVQQERQVPVGGQSAQVCRHWNLAASSVGYCAQWERRAHHRDDVVGRASLSPTTLVSNYQSQLAPVEWLARGSIDLRQHAQVPHTIYTWFNSRTLTNLRRIFNVTVNLNEHEQVYRLHESGAHKIVTFTFGGSKQPSWQHFTIYFMTDAGDVYSLCPVIPYYWYTTKVLCE